MLRNCAGSRFAGSVTKECRTLLPHVKVLLVAMKLWLNVISGSTIRSLRARTGSGSSRTTKPSRTRHRQFASRLDTLGPRRAAPPTTYTPDLLLVEESQSPENNYAQTKEFTCHQAELNLAVQISKCHVLGCSCFDLASEPTPDGAQSLSPSIPTQILNAFD
jgi:hypothetical protein